MIGKLYTLTVDYDFGKKGDIVLYLREDTRYAQQHWVVPPDGRQQSVWEGHLEPVAAD